MQCGFMWLCTFIHGIHKIMLKSCTIQLTTQLTQVIQGSEELQTDNGIPLENAESKFALKQNVLQMSLCFMNHTTDIEVWIKKICVLSSLWVYCALQILLIETVSIDSWLVHQLQLAQAILILYQKTKKPEMLSFKVVLLFFLMKQCYPVCNQMVGVNHQRQNTS